MMGKNFGGSVIPVEWFVDRAFTVHQYNMIAQISDEWGSISLN